LLNQIIFQSHWSDHWPSLIYLGKPTFPMNFIKFWYFNFFLLRLGWIWVIDLPFKNHLNHQSIMLHLNLPMNLDHRSTSFWKNPKKNPYHRSLPLTKLRNRYWSSTIPFEKLQKQILTIDPLHFKKT
jgi:hypothetical protein